MTISLLDYIAAVPALHSRTDINTLLSPSRGLCLPPTYDIVARITTLLNGVIDDKGGAAIATGWPVREHILGTDEFPVPLIDEHFARKYMSCIYAARMRKR